MSIAIYQRRKWEWNTFLHSGWFSTNRPHNQTPQINQQKYNFFLVLLTIRSPLFPQVTAKNIILLPGKKRDTKIAYHESFKEYWHKEGKIFVPYILGEYTRKGHEHHTIIEITNTAKKKHQTKHL